MVTDSHPAFFYFKVNIAPLALKTAKLIHQIVMRTLPLISKTSCGSLLLTS